MRGHSPVKLLRRFAPSAAARRAVRLVGTSQLLRAPPLGRRRCEARGPRERQAAAWEQRRCERFALLHGARECARSNFLRFPHSSPFDGRVRIPEKC